MSFVACFQRCGDGGSWLSVARCVREAHVWLLGAVNAEAVQARRESKKVLRGFEPRSLDSESRVLTVTPRDQMAFDTN